MQVLMRVAQMVDRLAGGGQERIAANFAAGLVPYVERSLALATRGGGPYEDIASHAGAQVKVFDRKSRYDLHVWFHYLAWLKYWNPDVLHVHTPGSLPAAVAFKRALSSRTKVVLHMHNVERQVLATRRDADRWYKELEPYVDLAFFTNTDVNEHLQKLGYSNEKLKLKMNPIEMNKWLRPQALPQDDREFRVAVVAQWRPEKGLLSVVEAALIAKSKFGFEGSWLFAGDIDSTLTADALRLINDNGLKEKVQILGRVADVAELLHGCDVGVLASKHEGQPNSLLEYGAAGIPAVVSNVEGSRELISPERGFIGFEYDHPDELADIIYRLSVDRQRCRQLGRAAHKYVAEIASVETVIAETENDYRTLLER